MRTVNTYAAAFLLLCATAGQAQTGARLQPGQMVHATLPADGTLTYELEVPQGTFVAGRVEQDGVAATVTITGPDGARVLSAARVGRGAPETFAFESQASGRYQLQVTPTTAGRGGAVRVGLNRWEPVAVTPEGRVDQAAAQLGEDTPGVVVGVIRNGELAFVRGYGAADLTHGVPFTPETPTNIGSTSKQFTGFALALLASRGTLSLDDEVRRHVPELPDFGHRVTLRHLLGHTSGYREYIGTFMMAGRQMLEGDYASLDEIIELVRRQPTLQSAPGTEFNYNNSAYSLSALVVERVSGRPFAEWMREEVFLPLGMTRTWVRASPSQIIPGRSMGYIAGEDGFREAGDVHASAGAGAMYTTPGDAAKWMRNFRTGELGGPEVIRELTTSGVLNTGAATNYGLGLFLDTNRGLRRWQHGGGDIAHTSTFIYYPDLDAGYVVFSNYRGVPGGIAGVVAEAFFGEHMTSDQGLAATAAGGSPARLIAEARPAVELAGFAGRYFSEELETFYDLQLEEGRLVIRHRRFGPTPLNHVDGDTFSGPLPVTSVMFRRDDRGNVIGLEAGNGRSRGISFEKIDR